MRSLLRDVRGSRSARLSVCIFGIATQRIPLQNKVRDRDILMAGRTADIPLHLIQRHRIPLSFLFRSLMRGNGEGGGSDRVRPAGFFPH